MSEQATRRAAGELEADILGVLWANAEPVGVGEILAGLHGDVVYTTVAKVLDRLHAKGKVIRVLEGRSFRYSPVTIESTAVAVQVRRLLDRAGSRRAVLQGFVDSLDSGDSEILAALLRQAEQQRASTTNGGDRA